MGRHRFQPTLSRGPRRPHEQLPLRYSLVSRPTGATILPPPQETADEAAAWERMRVAARAELTAAAARKRAHLAASEARRAQRTAQIAQSEAAAVEAKKRADAARMAVARAAKAEKAAKRVMAAPVKRGARMLAIPGKRGLCCRGDIVQCTVRNGYGRGLEGFGAIISSSVSNRSGRTSVNIVSTPDTNMFDILRTAARPVGGSVSAVRERARSTFYVKRNGREIWDFNY